MAAPARTVLEHVPDLAAIQMAMEANVRAQRGDQVCDAIPRRTEEGLRHGRLRKPGPRLQAQPVDELVRPDPEQAPAIDLDLGNSWGMSDEAQTEFREAFPNVKWPHEL